MLPKKVLILKIFPKLCQTFCVFYSCHTYFTLLLKPEKCVTERNRRLSLWRLFIDKRNQFFIPADWIIETDLCQILCVWFLNFYQTERVWIVFLQHVLPKLGKITVTFHSEQKEPESVNFDLSKISKTNINFELLRFSKMTSLKI